MGDASVASDWGTSAEPAQPMHGDDVLGASADASMQRSGPGAADEELKDQCGPGRKHGTVQFHYAATALDQDMRDALAAFDLDQNGTVSTQELLAGAKALKEVRGQTKFMRKVLVLVGVALVVALLSVFGVSLLAVELGKEVAVSGAVLTTPAGEHVQVESADMYVSESGDLRMRQHADDARRLQTTSQTSVQTEHIHVMQTTSHASVQTRAACDMEYHDQGSTPALTAYSMTMTYEAARAILAEHVSSPTTPITIEFAPQQFATVTADSYSIESDRSFGIEGVCRARPCNRARWALECAGCSEPDCLCRVIVEDELEAPQRRLRALERELRDRALASGPARELQASLAGKRRPLPSCRAFHVVDGGRGACPAPLSRPDEAECELFARALDASYTGAWPRTDRPGGCWLGTAGKVNYNPLAGVASPGRQLLCKVGVRDSTSCSDGEQNGDETGLDCGGSCAACVHPFRPGVTGGNACQPGDEPLTAAQCEAAARLAGFGWNGVRERADRPGGCWVGAAGRMNYNPSWTPAGPGGAASPGRTPWCAAPSCDDGVWNGDETLLDCGGSCGPCSACDDGNHNGDEAGVDCGGSCPAACPTAAPTCSDGIQNGDEAGIDCGGPCAFACNAQVNGTATYAPGFLGCWQDNAAPQYRTFPYLIGAAGSVATAATEGAAMTFEDCRQECTARGSQFFGRQGAQQCWCSLHAQPTSDDYWTAEQARGGYWTPGTPGTPRGGYDYYGRSDQCDCDLAATSIGSDVNCVYAVQRAPAPKR